ncbi:hypothetical protein FB567DRAFT_160369 [Paraphoma chrysanthemicola]|uniref:Uncharacterized protein n=1 Tax=Paraphoma chrysanthemicola TaxID=798071 RepID=A0A8K0W2Q2_9PLEO|nr:hypothetical protein FB567DRAFT_160369 [Paraphoma chrysanthemicola]
MSVVRGFVGGRKGFCMPVSIQRLCSKIPWSERKERSTARSHLPDPHTGGCLGNAGGKLPCALSPKFRSAALIFVVVPCIAQNCAVAQLFAALRYDATAVPHPAVAANGIPSEGNAPPTCLRQLSQLERSNKTRFQSAMAPFSLVRLPSKASASTGVAL